MGELKVIMHELEWKIFDEDLITRHNDLIFRLDYQIIGVYGSGRCYKLQVRKVDELGFRDMGYTFITKNDGHGLVKERSVNGRLWINTSEIVVKAEEYLKENYFI